MNRYNSQTRYPTFNRLVAYINVLGQFLFLGGSWLSATSIVWHVILCGLAFVLADFVNGLVHLYMDQNDHYTGFIGALVAAFHLHHNSLRYQDKPIWRIYIDESGYKVWLAMLQIMTAMAWWAHAVPAPLLGFLSYFFIFSSLAEVSHFLCHNSRSTWVKHLQSAHILLPLQHHMRHHILDNVNYAFLNGLSDPLINRIAQYCSTGYATTTDKHSALYLHNQQINDKHTP